MEPQSLSTCNQCGKKFQRKAHLLRHQQQHSGDRPYSCKFCSKTFKRSDVLRDHFSRCERRGNSAIPTSLERGRKRHACDECSRLKVKCDNNVPCRKCTEFGRICVKSRPNGAASILEETTPPNPPTPDTGSDRNSISFLLNCPGETDFMREFPKSTTLSPNNQPVDLSNLMSTRQNYKPPPGATPGASTACQDYGYMIQESNLDVFLSHLEFSTFEQQTGNWQMQNENMILWSGPDALFIDRTVLEQRAFDIREKLKYTAATMNAPHAPSKELLEAVELVTASNVAGYIKLYFRHWHKHGPMVHEATFNPCTAALPLVLALMSLGGMYSKESQDVERLKSLLDVIEYFIYSIPGLADEYDAPGRIYVKQGENASLEWQQYQLEELQGAYLMIVLQYWNGNPTARTRVRQQRFTRVVAIFHHLDLQSISHTHPPVPITSQPLFRSWILRESLIRLSTLALMLDNAFGIFNNMPPRFQWSEIDVSFQSEDRFFQLGNYEEMVKKGLKPEGKCKIKEAFLGLFGGIEEGERWRERGLSALDAQMLIHFLYTHLWLSTFSSPLACLSASLPLTNPPPPVSHATAVLTPFHTATNNWKLLWDSIKASSQTEEWNKLGFQRTAETYYDAVKEVMAVWERGQGRFAAMGGECEKGAHLKRLLSF